MKKPSVDYREFRFSRLNEPRFSHIKLLLGWIVYFALYFITENCIPPQRCHVIHCTLDDLIPFNEYFLVFYCFWYVLVAFSLLYFLLYNIPAFRQLQIFIMVTQAVAMAAYIFYPSIQLLRPAQMPRDNFFTQVLALIYAFDTPTGVCPSLHVAYSLGIASVWVKQRQTPLAWRVFVVFSAVMISLSTAFVKQHSVVDILLALPVGLLAEYVAFYLPKHGARHGRLSRKVARK